MQHDGFTYIFLTGQRKAFDHDVPKDWEGVAYERFDYVECGVWRKRTAELTDKDQSDWVEYHGEPDENFISPGDWKWPEEKHGAVPPTIHGSILMMRQPKAVHWEPKEDITAYELAMAIPIVLSSWGPLSFLEDHIAALAPDVRRHFRVGDKS